MATSYWEGKLRGLCGTFDRNSRNDYVTPDGMMASTTAEFGNSWKLSKQTCRDVPNDNPVDMCKVRRFIFLKIFSVIED